MILALALVCAIAPAQDEAIELEWRIRRLALNEEPLTEFDHSDWQQREARYEVARRRRLIDLPAQDVDIRAGLEDEHPNVRARALTLVDETGDLPDSVRKRLASDPSPEVRLELARALIRIGAPLGSKALTVLGKDPDEEVSGAVHEGLRGWGVLNLLPEATSLQEVHAAQRDAFRSIDRSQGARAFADELVLFLRAPRDRSLFEPLPRAAQAGSGVAEQDSVLSGRMRSRSAVLAAIRATLTGELDEEVLLAGWLAPLDVERDERERDQVRLLLDGARRGGARLAERFLREAHGIATGAPELGALASDVRDAEDAIEALVEGAVEIRPAREVARLLLEVGLADEHSRTYWERLTETDEAWRAEDLAPWLAETRDLELRLAVAHVAADTLSEIDDAGSAESLVPLLSDSDALLRDLAFRALARRPGPAATDSALHAAWTQYGTEERLERLTLLSRERPPIAFREDLLALGSDRRTRTQSLIELLSLFVADEEVAARLEGWLFDDLSVATALEQDDSRRARPESLARGAVRALHRMNAERRVEVLSRALAASAKSSVEVAKTAVFALGRDERGIGELRPYLDEGVVQRVRIEAALALAATANDVALAIRAEGILRSAYWNCDGELRGRILRRFGELASAESVRFLERVATRKDEPVERQIAALSAIGARRTGAIGSHLATCLDNAPNIEVLRAVISLAGEHCDSTLTERLSGWLARGLESDESAQLVRDELLPALAGCAELVELAGREVVSLPLKRARLELAERFRGRRLAATEFTYRGEVKAFERLVRADESRVVPFDAIWKLDGRFLFALAEAARSAGGVDVAHQLIRAARIAFEGEAPTDRQRLSIVEARARLWAYADARGERVRATRFARELYVDWISGRIDRRDFETVFGLRDEAAGRDPVARLESAILQGRAWASLASAARMDGEARESQLDAAREAAREARERTSCSESARRAQEKLERAIQ